MPTSIIALSGPSSSGKTTLARLLKTVFSSPPPTSTSNSTSTPPLKTFLIHEDDFYHPDNKIPTITLPTGTQIQDWDCIGALNLRLLSSALQYVKERGSLPPRLKSKEDLNDVHVSSSSSSDSDSSAARVGEDVLVQLNRYVLDRVRKLGFLGGDGDGDGDGHGLLTIAFLEGFLLYAPPPSSPSPSPENNNNTGAFLKKKKEEEEKEKEHPLHPIHAKINVHLFLPAPYALVKERRERRSGYVTIGPAPDPVLPQRSSSFSSSASTAGEEGALDLLEGDGDGDGDAAQNFWTDPPGYVDDVVWPRYVRDHSWLLLPEVEEEGGGEGDLEGIEDTQELIRRVGQGVRLRTDAGVIVAPGQGRLPMVDLLKWAVDEVLKHLEEVYQRP